MHSFSVPVTADGALVDVRVELAAANVQVLRYAGRPVPAAVAARALLDSGSEVTCVDPSILAPLIAAAGLHPARFVLANVPMAGGVNLSAEYFVGISVVHPAGTPRADLILRNHPVVEQTLGTLGLHVLIGRDILDRCLSVYDGPGKAYTLAY